MGQGVEELSVYQRARELTNRVYQVTRVGTFVRDYSLVDQVRRASLSVMCNIADGFERGTNDEFLDFLLVAKGSCGQVLAQVSVAFDQKYISKTDYGDLTDRCRRISGMLGNLIHHLKRSQLSGRKIERPSPKSTTEELNEITENKKREE